MAKKRKSETMDGQAGAGAQPQAPPNGNPLHFKQDLADMCKTAGIDLPYNEVSSPAKSHESLGSYVFKLYHLLWWKNQVALSTALNNYYHELPTDHATTRRSRLELLQNYLKGPAEETKMICATPRKTPKTSFTSRSTQPLSEPSSPTLGIKRHFATSKPGLSSDGYIKAAPSKASVIPNPVTSFASTTTNTSFANTSFRSNAESTRTLDTAATSFSSDFQAPKRDSNYLSSLCSTDAAELMAMAQAAESSQTSSSSNRTVRALFTSGKKTPASSRGSQSTYYGSLDLDQLQSLETARLGSEASHKSVTNDVPMESGDDSSSDSMDPSKRHRHNLDPPPEPATLSSVRRQKDRHNQQPPVQFGHAVSPTKVLPSAKEDADDLIQSELPAPFQSLPFELQWEVRRLLQMDKITLDTLQSQWTFRTSESLYRLLDSCSINFARPPRPDMLKEWEVMTRNTRLEWTASKIGPPLKMTVLVGCQDTACSLQRHLGADRVLYVELPDMGKPPSTMTGTEVQFRFEKWLQRPHTILGRTWYPFFLQPNKKKSAFEGRATAGMNRLIMIAPPDGTSICDIMQWALPFRTNSHQAACKAFMRLELLLSRTVVAAVLEAKDFAYAIPDCTATCHAADRRFEDPKLSHLFHEEFDPNMVMNDGCNDVHPWIVHQYMKKVGLKSMPAGLQMRTAGAKGMWYLSDNEYTAHGEKPPAPLIKLSKSQLKVFRDNLEGCDDEVRSVCVVNPNPGARPAILYQAFLPILVDRGVPVQAVREVVEEQVQSEMNEFLQALEAPGTLSLRRWLATRNDFFEARTREHGIDTLASGFPNSTEERVIKMLENGFDHKECKFLAREVLFQANSYFDLRKNNLKVQINKSTQLRGMADTQGFLEPGEVCVVFGSPFEDDATGESWWCLDQVEILLCRNPALAPWDIQKVRAVFHPQLARLKNFIIFSTKGMRPLANLLQGGDYDGDTFWFTWEPKLVRPFKNAPAPWQPPTPEKFGIRKDKSRLSNHISDSHSEAQWSAFLGKMCWTRMSAKMLGIVTLYHERLAYARGSIAHPDVLDVVPLHDYLVDADKQGYDFNQEDWSLYLRSRRLPADLPKPAYWEYTRPDDQKKAKGPVSYHINDVEVRGNIIDTIYFDVVDPIVKKAMIRASVMLDEAGTYDADLARFYNQTLESQAKGSDIRREMLKLKDSLSTVRETWASASGNMPFPDVVASARAVYDSIQPMNPLSTTAVEWLRRQGNGYTIWDKLKASCLARTQYRGDKPGSMMFNVAGNELCCLKLNELDEETHYMLQSYYLTMKMRRLRKAQESDDFGEDGGDQVENNERDGYY